MAFVFDPTEQTGRSSRLHNGCQSIADVQFFRSTLLPALIVLLFALALVAVSARIWLPGDMLAPAPIG